MYLEETMEDTGTAARWINHLSTRLDYILTEQQQMNGRLQALEHPLSGFEGGASGEIARLRSDNAELRSEVVRLRSRLQMMQAGYNAIATIQARLDANEQEMGGKRCCTG